jgi:hypothetical protein
LNETQQAVGIAFLFGLFALAVALAAIVIAWRARKAHALSQSERADLDRRLVNLREIERRTDDAVAQEVARRLRSALGSPDTATTLAASLIRHPPFMQMLIDMLRDDREFIDRFASDIIADLAKPELLPANVKADIAAAAHKAIAERAPQILREDDEALNKIVRFVLRDAARELPADTRQKVASLVSASVLSRVQAWSEDDEDDDLTEIAQAIVKELGKLENLSAEKRAEILEVIEKAVVQKIESWTEDDDEAITDLATAALRDVKLENLTTVTRQAVLAKIEEAVVQKIQGWTEDDDDDITDLATAALRAIKVEHLSPKTRDELVRIVSEEVLTKIQGKIDDGDEELDDLVRDALRRYVDEGGLTAALGKVKV